MTLHFTGGYFNYPSSYSENQAPTIDDDIVLGATPGNLTISGNCVCKSIDFAGYTGSITWTAWSKLTYVTNCILDYGNMSGAEGCALQAQGNGNFKCAYLTGALILTNNPTLNLLADVTISKGVLTQSNVVLNGSGYRFISGYTGGTCLDNDYAISGSAIVKLSNGIWKGKGSISNTIELAGTVDRMVRIHG